jgi:hypothetical protein
VINTFNPKKLHEHQKVIETINPADRFPANKTRGGEKTEKKGNKISIDLTEEDISSLPDEVPPTNSFHFFFFYFFGITVDFFCHD